MKPIKTNDKRKNDQRKQKKKKNQNGRECLRIDKIKRKIKIL